MTQNELLIRDERKEDVVAITAVTIAAFKTLEISSHTEQYVVEALRCAGALSVSLLAEMNVEIVGHIAFSPLKMSDDTPGWYGLGPVSVLPEQQGKGIGKALIEAGLDRLKAMGGRGCCLVGHPGYYVKFGFNHPDGLVLEGVPPEVFFALSFDGWMPKGTVTFHEAFLAQGPQESA